MNTRHLFPVLTLFLCLASPAAPALAAHDHGKEQGCASHAAPAGAASVYTAKGKVTQVEKAAGKVIIDHEPVPVLKWPQMVMPFGVEDASLLDGLKKGDAVRLDFRLEGAGGHDPVIVDIEVLR